MERVAGRTVSRRAVIGRGRSIGLVCAVDGDLHICRVEAAVPIGDRVAEGVACRLSVLQRFELTVGVVADHPSDQGHLSGGTGAVDRDHGHHVACIGVGVVVQYVDVDGGPVFTDRGRVIVGRRRVTDRWPGDRLDVDCIDVETGEAVQVTVKDQGEAARGVRTGGTGELDDVVAAAGDPANGEGAADRHGQVAGCAVGRQTHEVLGGESDVRAVKLDRPGRVVEGDDVLVGPGKGAAAGCRDAQPAKGRDQGLANRRLGDTDHVLVAGGETCGRTIELKSETPGGACPQGGWGEHHDV